MGCSIVTGAPPVGQLSFTPGAYDHSCEHFLESPNDAVILRKRLSVFAEALPQDFPHKAQGPQLAIGLLQRSENRKILNMPSLVEALETAFSEATIDIAIFDGKPPIWQAYWMASHDIIIAAHGAALANAVFARTGAIIVELFPQNYAQLCFYRPLIRESGGMSIQWYNGSDPIGDFANHNATFYERKRWRSISFSTNVTTVVGVIKRALGMGGKLDVFGVRVRS